MKPFFARCLPVTCVMIRVIAALGVATAANARSPMIIGVGTLSCGQWLTDRQGLHSAQDIEAWITGYLSGFGAYVLHGDITRGSDNKALFVWIDDYCHDHPLDDVAVATDHLIEALKAR
jgi:hypothetical protein